jgi:hypothetical protein
MDKSYTKKIKFTVKVLTVMFVLTISNSWGQTIVSDDFENIVTLFSNSGGPSYYSGNSAVGDRPATTSFVQSGTYSIGKSGGTAAILTSSLINTASCSSMQLTFKVASFSIGSTANGADASDYVRVEVSPDGGTTFYNTLEINGNSNAYWGFATGTGVASTAYDGNVTPVIFAPAGGGSRTADGYSTINISSLPSVSNLVIRISFDDDSNEQWNIDNFVLSGSCCAAATTTITSPATQTVCTGAVTTLTVTSSATIPSYTWQASANGATGWADVVNATPAGASYSGINTSTLSITAGSTYYYQCLVTENGTCTATSATSTLVVNTNPTITTQPVNKTICSGSNTSFTVAASGAPLTYQWQEKVGAGAFANITNGGVYGGATSATLVLTNPGVGMSTNQYQCIVSVAVCSNVTSSAVVLTVNTTPATPAAPTTPANPACNSAILTSVAAPAGISWYWQNTSSTTSITTLPSTTDYTVNSSGTYYIRAVDVSGTCWSASTGTAIAINTSPAVTLAAVSKTVCSGTTVTFTTAASGTSPTYQWQLNSGAGFGDIAAATTKTLNLGAVTPSMNSYTYQCVISVVSCATITTSPYILTVNTTPAAPTAPTTPANPACNSAILTSVAAPVGVSWYWQNTSSTTSITTLPSTADYTVNSSGTYYVRAVDVSGTCWSASTGTAITINTSPSIGTQPTSKNICSETNTSIDITGASATTKQWQVSIDGGSTFVNLVNGGVYSGVTNSSLVLTNVPASYSGYIYQCVLTNPGCPVLPSSMAVLSVTQTPSAPPTPTASANPACLNTTLIAMTSTVSGQTWYWQGTTSAGSSTTNPTSSAFNVSASGTYYVRARTDGSSCLSTQTSTVITINQPPTVTSNPSDRTQCVGTNTTFAVSATGTGLTYIWQVNTGAGFGNLVNVAPYSNVTTATMSITNITAGMNGYQYQCVVSGASPCAATTSSFATLIITSSGEPATAASSPITNAVACNAFNLSWTNGSGSNRLVVVSASAIAGNPTDGTSYTANTAFGSGSTIAVGEYVVYKGTSNSVFITGLNASTTYYYKIFEFNGCALDYLTSGIVPNGNVTTIACSSPAGITGVYIDACAGGCNLEGPNELIWGNSGSYALKVSTNGPTLNYNSTTPPTNTYISTYGLYSSNIAALNTAAGSCTNTVFVDPNTQGYIPANSRFLIAHSCMCSPSAYDFNGLCNAGPIYVVFGNDAVWPCDAGGIFGNSGAGIRYFDLNMNSWGAPLDPIYSYSPSALVGGNGAYALFNPTGGYTTGYGNSTCLIPLVVLPIELLDFYATKNGKGNEVIWKVAQEENILYYTIEKSKDAVDFTAVATVYANNEIHTRSYSTFDNEPYRDITYYRLSTKEINGTTKNYGIISVDEADHDWEYIHYQIENNMVVEFKNSLPKNSVVGLYDINGKELITQSIKQSQTILNTDMLSSGVYFVRLSTPYKTEHFKIIITK